MNASRRNAGSTQAAELDFAARLKAAISLFDAPAKPLWRRTVDGMLAFRGLDLDDLPPRILRRIDQRFVAINRILAHYALQTWDDYQHITDEDLRRLQDNIRSLAGTP